MRFLNKHKLTFLGLALGAMCGFLYYYFFGRHYNNSSITSRPIYSTLYGTVMGALLFTFLKEEEAKEKGNN